MFCPNFVVPDWPPFCGPPMLQFVSSCFYVPKLRPPIQLSCHSHSSFSFMACLEQEKKTRKISTREVAKKVFFSPV